MSDLTETFEHRIAGVRDVIRVETTGEVPDAVVLQSGPMVWLILPTTTDDVFDLELIAFNGGIFVGSDSLTLRPK